MDHAHHEARRQEPVRLAPSVYFLCGELRPPSKESNWGQLAKSRPNRGRPQLDCAVRTGDGFLPLGRLGVALRRLVLPIAAVPDPGHSGAAMFFGPTVCLSAVLPTTHTHRCLLSASLGSWVLSLVSWVFGSVWPMTARQLIPPRRCGSLAFMADSEAALKSRPCVAFIIRSALVCLETGNPWMTTKGTDAKAASKSRRWVAFLSGRP